MDTIRCTNSKWRLNTGCKTDGHKISLRVVGALMPPVERTVQIYLCFSSTHFLHSNCHNLDIYYITELAPLLPVDRRPCPVLPVIMSQLFSLCYRLQVWGRQDSVSALETDSNRSETNSLWYNHNQCRLIIQEIPTPRAFIFWPTA